MGMRIIIPPQGVRILEVNNTSPIDNTKVPNSYISSLDHRYGNANHYSSPRCKNS